jgi:hypothetical protein
VIVSVKRFALEWAGFQAFSTIFFADSFTAAMLAQRRAKSPQPAPHLFLNRF